MSAHPVSSVIAETGCSVVFFLTRLRLVPGAVLSAQGNPKEGIIMCIVNAMSRYVLDNGVQLSGCKALYNLADQHQPNSIAIIQVGGLVRISSAMHMFPANNWLHTVACAILRILSESSICSQWPTQCNVSPVIGCILNAMHLYAADDSLQVPMADFLCLSYALTQCLFMLCIFHVQTLSSH